MIIKPSNANCIYISLLSEELAIALWSNLRTKLIVGAGLNPENGKRGGRTTGVGVEAGNRLTGLRNRRFLKHFLLQKV